MLVPLFLSFDIFMCRFGQRLIIHGTVYFLKYLKKDETFNENRRESSAITHNHLSYRIGRSLIWHVFR